MSELSLNMMISLDGFVAGPSTSPMRQTRVTRLLLQRLTVVRTPTPEALAHCDGASEVAIGQRRELPTRLVPLWSSGRLALQYPAGSFRRGKPSFEDAIRQA